MGQIEIKDVAPIKNWMIPVPEEGGVVELRGPNGCGKSHAINAVNALVAGEGRVSVRDGAVAASVTGLGATLIVSRKTTRAGELEVDSIHGKLDISDIIDPGLKSEESADAARIKAIIAVSGAKANWQEFRALLPSETVYDEAISPEIRAITDPITLASKVKAAYEKQARSFEERAAASAASAASCADAVTGAELVVNACKSQLRPDVEAKPEFQEYYAQAVRTSVIALAKTEERMAESERNSAAIRELRAQIESKPSVQQRIERIGSQIGDHNREIDRLGEIYLQDSDTITYYDDKIAKLKQQIDELLAKQEQSIQSRSSTAALRDSEVKLLQKCEEQLSREHQVLSAIHKAEDTLASMDAGAPISDADVQAAQEALTAAETTNQHYLSFVDADSRLRAQRAALEGNQKKANEEFTQAGCYRNAAGQVDSVLSGMISKLGVPLKVQSGRLYASTQRSDKEPFAELSHGQRGKLAIEIGIGSMTGGKTGLLTIQQEVWEGLDQKAKQEIAEHARSRKVVILTASCDATGDKPSISVY